MKSDIRARYLLIAGAAVAMPIVVARPAVAQEGPEASSSGGEIIVTAQRRSERLEDVPMSIVSASAATIENADVTSVHEIGRIAPGVQVNFGGANTQPAIRGVTTLTNGTGIENNVAIYIDGFYEPNPTFINTDFGNVESIEVLKGPQGTLYGRNATGGAILINTKRPSDEFTASAEARYARFNDWIGKGYISGPLSSFARFSISGYFHEGDGYIKLLPNPVTGEKAGNASPVKQHSVRAKVEVDLAEDLTATLGYNYGFNDDARGQLFTPFDHVPATHPAPPLRATKLGTASYNFDNQIKNTLHQGTLKISYDLPGITINSYTGYTDHKGRNSFDFDGTFSNINYNDAKYTQETFQQALDISIKYVEDLDLIFGLSYYKDKFQYDPDFGARAFVSGAFRSQINVNSDTEALAAYIDGTFHATERLSINLGGRYSYETKDFFQSVIDANNQFILPPTRRRAEFSKFTPRASIRYEFAPRTSVYASWSRGFRSGTFNVAAAASPELVIPTRPENVDAYEVGLKLARRGLQFDVAGFYYDYTDINASLLIPSPVCGNDPNCGLVASVFGNAKGAEIYGIDGQLILRPLESLSIRLGAAWLHARYTDFDNAVGTALDPVTDRNLSGQTQDWTGFQMARAPDFSGNAGVEYAVPVADGSLLLAANVNYSDGYVVSNPSLFCSATCTGGLERKQRYRTKSFTQLAAQATWTAPSDRFWIGVFGKNLTNERFRVTYNGGAFGDYSALSEPRTYGVKAGFQF